jgi:hypothetical protein
MASEQGFAEASGTFRFGKRFADLGKPAEKRAFQSNDGSFSGKNRIFPVIFRGQILRYGIFWGGKFSTGIDFKRVTNNMQGFLGNLYPRGV